MSSFSSSRGEEEKCRRASATVDHIADALSPPKLRDDAGFITFLGKFGLALMYMGFGVVFFGVSRMLWSKRFALLKAPSSRTSGPIALPFHVPDPYGRPGTPGSRPGSPSRTGTPHQQQSGRQGVLCQLFPLVR